MSITTTKGVEGPHKWHAVLKARVGDGNGDISWHNFHLDDYFHFLRLVIKTTDILLEFWRLKVGNPVPWSRCQWDCPSLGAQEISFLASSDFCWLLASLDLWPHQSLSPWSDFPSVSVHSPPTSHLSGFMQTAFRAHTGDPGKSPFLSSLT
jgi:hypothetical protein